MTEKDILVDVRSFGELLRWFRSRSQLTQQKLAERLGVRRSTISDWENNQFAPKYRDHVAKLAEIFHLSPVETNHFLQAALFHVSPPTPTFEPHNPYKGLSAFTQADHHAFFGRETLVEELIQVLQQKDRQLLVAIGPSGCGKTSTILAGLLPKLQQGAIAGSEEWVYIEPFRPGRDPLVSLAEVFTQVLKREPDDILQDLSASPQGLSLLVSTLTEEKKRPVVLILDQFEELFGRDVDADNRHQFIRLLVTACRELEIAIRVMLVLRADCYANLTAYPELARLVVECQQLILPLDQEREVLRRIIEEPAALPHVKLTLEGNLVDEILFDLQKQVGVLPLLQFTLYQLFQRREQHTLTMHAYQDIGGVKGALAQYVEQVYLDLPSQKHQQLTRFLFLRLLQVEKQRAGSLLITRRQATLEEFVLLNPQDTQVLREVITIFVGKRLLVTNRSGESSVLEVSHEALIREWPRLVDWLATNRSDILLQGDLSTDVTEWLRRNCPADRLYRGTQFKEARDWAKRNTTNRQERAFLQASAARQRRAFISVVAVLLLVLASLGTAGWVASHQPAPPPKAGYVTTTDEYATGSLRWAIGNAHSGDTITFAPSLGGKTIILHNAPLYITQQNLTIPGLTIGHITIQEIGASLIVDKSASMTISDVAFQGSKTTKDQPSLIQNQGRLTLTHCTISGNTTSTSTSSSAGGGISNSGTLTLTNSTVSGNTAYSSHFSYSRGGGIYNYGTMTLTNSTVSGNTAYSPPFSAGGGIYSEGSITMINSTISGNTAPSSSSQGGGIYCYGTLTMINSIVSGNTTSSSSYSRGGGIYSYAALLTLTNSTVSDNTSSFGGGIVSFSDNTIPKVTLIFSTIVNNRASSGDGFDITNINATLPQIYIKASIIGGNDTQHNPIAGVITSGGYNVIQHMSLSNFNTSPEQNTDHSANDLSGVFGPHPHLQNNGGPTQTYQLALGAGNSALDAIPVDVCTDDKDQRVLDDQRGMPRPGKNKQSCDIGAYESQR